MRSVTDRFLEYIKIDTKADPSSNSVPSSAKQFNLANKIKEEFEAMGIKVKLDSKCYLFAEIPANSSREIPTIGFISHLDTAPDMPGDCTNPQTIKNYDGKDIILNKEQDIILSPLDFPELLKYKGQSLITTNGTTLLGADDKAGVAEILTAAEYITTHPEMEHGKIMFGFTPDEEIGRGADHFDVEDFGADYAYTMDGGEIGELEYENFNAAGLSIEFHGRNVHPGTAKNQMINSLNIAQEFNALLPPFERPEHTEHYEGFFHLMSMNGDVESTKEYLIVRDHDIDKFESKKKIVLSSIALMKAKYGDNCLTYTLEDNYYNMREKVEPVKFIVDIAEQAIKEAGIKPHIIPIRGGTDGSRLSYMGLPCPNIFAGGHNFHGKYEFIPIHSMEKATEVIINIVKGFAKIKK